MILVVIVSTRVVVSPWTTLPTADPGCGGLPHLHHLQYSGSAKPGLDGKNWQVWSDSVALCCTLYLIWCDRCDATIAMDIWTRSHASTCNSVTLSTVLCDWSFGLAHCRLPSKLVYVPVTYWPAVTAETPSPNTPSFKELEICEGVTRKPRCHWSRHSYHSLAISQSSPFVPKTYRCFILTFITSWIVLSPQLNSIWSVWYDRVEYGSGRPSHLVLG